MEKNRIDILPDISGAFNDLADDARGIGHVRVKSFLPLSEEEKSALQAKLGVITGKTVIMDTETDSSLLGGVSIRIGDSVVDGTVATTKLEPVVGVAPASATLAVSGWSPIPNWAAPRPVTITSSPTARP